MNVFTSIAIDVSKYYYYLKRMRIFKKDQAAFAAICISIENLFKNRNISIKDVREAFTYASKGVCSLNGYETKHDKSDIEYKSFSSDFYVNLMLQIGCLFIHADGINEKYIIDNCSRFKTEVIDYTYYAIEGVFILDSKEKERDTELEILKAFENANLVKEIFDFKLFNNLIDDSSEKFIDGRPGEKEYAKAMTLFQTNEYETAFPLISISARKGFSYGISSLGSYYRNGVVVEKNIKKAIELYEKAGQSNNPIALYHLFEIYQNDEKAENYYNRSLIGGVLGICKGDCYAKDFLVNGLNVPLETVSEDSIFNFREKNSICGICGDKVEKGLFSKYMADFPKTYNVPIFESYPIIPRTNEMSFGNMNYCCMDCRAEISQEMKEIINSEFISIEEMYSVLDEKNLFLSAKGIIFIYHFVDLLDVDKEEKRTLFFETLK